VRAEKVATMEFPRQGWISPTPTESIPVLVLGRVGLCFRVRFTSRKRGLRNHVGTVRPGAVSFARPSADSSGRTFKMPPSKRVLTLKRRRKMLVRCKWAQKAAA
jgi:hypothetical protein